MHTPTQNLSYIIGKAYLISVILSFIAKDETTNIRDLPYSVSKDTKESCPLQKDFIASYCLPLNINPISFVVRSFIHIHEDSSYTFISLSSNTTLTLLHLEIKILSLTRHVDPTSNIRWCTTDKTRLVITSLSTYQQVLSVLLAPIRSHG